MTAIIGAFQQAIDELGATLNAALVVIGDRLGLYKALAGAGPLTPRELAERTDTHERYVREWLNAQAAGGYVTYDDGPLHAAGRARGRRCAELSGAFREVAAIAARRRTSRRTTCSAPAPTPSDRSSPRSTASRPSSRPACASPTSAAATAPRRWSWPTRSRSRTSAASTPTRQRSSRPARDAAYRARFEVATAQDFPAATTSWSRRSTACTTWATRWAPRATSARRSRRTARG